jgi:hypothetical protein
MDSEDLLGFSAHKGLWQEWQDTLHTLSKAIGGFEEGEMNSYEMESDREATYKLDISRTYNFMAAIYGFTKLH